MTRPCESVRPVTETGLKQRSFSPDLPEKRLFSVRMFRRYVACGKISPMFTSVTMRQNNCS